MINIKKFIDKVTYSDNRNSKDIVIPIVEARALKDEISKLILDINSLQNSKIEKNTDNIINVEFVGKKW